MAKHVGFFLLLCFVFSAIADDSNRPDVPLTRQYGGGNSKQRRELDFADIAKHLESVTSASTSIDDIKEAVLPFLNWRNKRSSGSGFDFAGIDISQLKTLSRKVRDLDYGAQFEKISKHIEHFVAKALKKLRKIVLPVVKTLKLEKPFSTLESFIVAALKPLGINLMAASSASEPT